MTGNARLLRSESRDWNDQHLRRFATADRRIPSRPPGTQRCAFSGWTPPLPATIRRAARSHRSSGFSLDGFSHVIYGISPCDGCFRLNAALISLDGDLDYVLPCIPCDLSLRSRIGYLSLVRSGVNPLCAWAESATSQLTKTSRNMGMTRLHHTAG